MHRPGVEPAISRSQVQRPTPPSNPFFLNKLMMRMMMMMMMMKVEKVEIKSASTSAGVGGPAPPWSSGSYGSRMKGLRIPSAATTTSAGRGSSATVTTSSSQDGRRCLDLPVIAGCVKARRVGDSSTSGMSPRSRCCLEDLATYSQDSRAVTELEWRLVV